MLARLLAWLSRRGSATNRPTPTPAAIESTLDSLIKLEYLKFVPDDNVEKVKSNLRQSLSRGYVEGAWRDDCTSSCLRSFPADSENLEEGDVGCCLRLMKSPLSIEGVILDTIVDVTDGPRYEVFINGEEFCIYDEADWNDDSTNLWSVSARRLIEIVNELLVRADSEERLWGVYGGNDGQVLFLTEQLHAYIKSLDFLSGEWLPYSSAEARFR